MFLYAVLVTAAAFLTACGSTSKATKANNDLRERNLALEREVEAMREELALRVDEIDTLEQRIDTQAKVTGAKLPAATRIRIAGLSGAVDEDGDGIDDVVRLYVRPTDQQGRFLVVAGRLVAQVVMIAPDGARELVRTTLEPDAFDKAYRSGITGTHYAVELKLPSPLPDGLAEVTAKVTFTDAATGAQLSDQKAMSVDSK